MVWAAVVLSLITSWSAVSVPASADANDGGSEWERLRFDAPSGLILGAGIEDVAWVGGQAGEEVSWIGDRFVALGLLLPQGADWSAARPGMWVSRDGRRWNEVTPDAMPADAQALSAVVSFGGALFVFGVGDDGRVSAWRASQRGVWERSVLSEPAVGTPFVAGAVTRGDQIVVHGYPGEDERPGVSDNAVVWVSDDGATWESSALPGYVTNIEATPDHRRLVALVNVGGVRRPTVFVSRDGLTWARTDQLGSSVDPGGDALGAWRGWMWAATYPGEKQSGSDASTLWKSRDGRSWRRAGRAPGHAVVDQFVVVDGQLVITGFASRSRPGAWTSDDGRRWDALSVARPSGGRLNRTASNGHIVVAFGSAGELRDFYRWGPSTLDAVGDDRHDDPSRVPLPNVDISSVAGGTVRFDAEAWQEAWATTPGSAERECITTDDHTELRSGEFIAGNFSSFVNGWDGTAETSKLYYVPLYPDVAQWPSDDGPPLLVSADLIDGASPMHLELQFEGLALGGDGTVFYATGTLLPVSGTWRLRPVAGRNEGCFIVSV